MTGINPSSISGITSITMPSGDGNVLTVHTNDGTERFRIDSSGNVKVGSAATISPDGDVFFTGVTTATTFTGAHSGSGANLTSLPAAQVTGTLPAISGANLTNLTAGNLTGALPAISAANCTNIPAANITGTLPAISGANLTGITAGITMAQTWKLDSDFTGNADPISGWTKYTDGNSGSLGSDMVEASGIFTFPSTGFYMIETQGYHYGSGSNESTTIFPKFSTDSGSSFGSINHSYTNIPNLSGTWYNTSYNKHFFDVTNVSTHKCKIVTSGNTQTIHTGGTFIRFIRLGDT